MTIGELFAGVSGFGLGFEQSGCTVAWQVEQDTNARKVLSARFPGVQQFDDVRTVGAHNLTYVDILCGGFPCQDVSVAGARKGLAGERTGLFFEAVRVAVELRTPWVVLENVPGLLSSHRGRDFAVVVETLVDSGYGVAWRVVDSRYFGVAQRRRRLFLVGCLGGQYQRAGAVLFEPARGGRDTAAGREAGTRIAATLRGRSHGPGVNAPGRGGEDDDNLVAFDTTQVTSPLNRSNPKPGDPCHPLAAGAHAPTIAFNWQTGGDCRYGFGDTTTGLSTQQTPAVYQCHGSNVDGSDNLIAATLNSGGNSGGFRTEPGEHLAVAYRMQALGQYNDDGMASTLKARDYKDATDRSVASHGVRRLTPLECERLQGFPPGWTCLCPAQGDTATCVCPDSPRYKQMGNAVTVPVIAWLARRLMAEAQRKVGAA